MRVRSVALVAGAICLAGGLARPAPAMGPDEHDAFYGEIAQDAQRYLDLDIPAETDVETLGLLQYEPEAVDRLPVLLQKPLGARLAPYVLSRLLTPLAQASDDRIRKLAPLVDVLHRRYDRYETLPGISAARARQLELPNPEKMTPEAFLKRVEQVQKQLREIQEKQEMVLRYNAQVSRLDRVAIQLRLVVGDERFDRRLVEQIVRKEREGDMTYANGIEAVGAAAARLSESRAKRFFDVFLKRGRDLRLEEEEFTDPTRIRADRDGEVTFGKEKDAVGLRYLVAAQALSVAHGFEAVNPPTEQDVKQEQKRRREQRRKSK